MRKLFIAAASLAGLVLANPASAAVYTYNTSRGSVLTIDTVAMTGSMIGADINATFSGAGLATFAGGFNLPSFMTNIAINPTSWRTVAGVTYIPNTNHQQMLETGAAAGGTNAINLWSYWGTAACPSCNYQGDYVDTALSSSGGTSVPEPGITGLLALGLLGAAFARRRARKVNFAMKPLAA